VYDSLFQWNGVQFVLDPPEYGEGRHIRCLS